MTSKGSFLNIILPNLPLQQAVTDKGSQEKLKQREWLIRFNGLKKLWIHRQIIQLKGNYKEKVIKLWKKSKVILHDSSNTGVYLCILVCIRK